MRVLFLGGWLLASVASATPLSYNLNAADGRHFEAVLDATARTEEVIDCGGIRTDRCSIAILDTPNLQDEPMVPGIDVAICFYDFENGGNLDLLWDFAFPYASREILGTYMGHVVTGGPGHDPATLTVSAADIAPEPGSALLSVLAFPLAAFLVFRRSKEPAEDEAQSASDPTDR